MILLRNSLFSAACAALLLAGAACQPSQAMRRPSWAQQLPAPPDPEDEARARHQLRTAQRAEAAGDRTGAEAMRTSLVRRYPTTEAAAWVYEARAHAAMQAGARAEAIDQLEHIFFLRPHFARLEAARRDYAVLLVEAGRADDALQLVRGLAPADASQSDAARATLARALVGPLQRAARPAAALAMLAEANGATEGVPPHLSEPAQLLLQAISDDELDALVRDSSRGSPGLRALRPSLLVKLSRLPVNAHDEAAQKRWLEEAAALDPQGPTGAQATALLAQTALRGEVAPATVGVLLPLTGRFSQFGERSRAAIELAFVERPDLKVVIKDTQGDPNLAAAAIDALVTEEHAIAAIGPMFSAEAVSAAARAEEAGLPLLSLSHQEGLTKAGSFVFRSALTVAAQAKALAKLSFEQLNMTKFALLAPNNRYGLEFVQAFWQEVEERRGSIRGIEMYAPDATTFRQPIRKLVGRWYLNARPEFREALQELKEKELSAVRMRSEVDRLDKRSRPIVDFDALVLPDSGRQLGLIAPALAFEDLAVGRDAKSLEKMRRTLNTNDIMPLTLLGASPWNGQQTLDACEQYCEGAIFVDAFFSASTEPAVREFITAFTARAGAEPSLSEAQAFDTASLVAHVLSGANWPKSRAALVAGLHGLESYAGLCGSVRFDADGEAQRELKALTIRGHKIESLSATAGPPSPSRAR